MSEREAQVETNKRIARDFMDAMSSGDAERILSRYCDDVTIWTAGSLPFSGNHDRAAAAALCAGLLGAFPDGLEFSIKAMTAEGERVAIEAEGRGTHASGKVYHQHYHFLLVIRDGKIAQMKEYFDTEQARDVLTASVAG
ncbi:MAG: nuclear transport factor 2 family protein [Deltaproteobacteria bacterium]|nr:nuclear transport factor 2 family protein [Deltaproteobacteria bacterium]MBW2359978.1 nuclear transport factor 2 family protein [Deltaproteobacteria bacterium]